MRDAPPSFRRGIHIRAKARKSENNLDAGSPGPMLLQLKKVRLVASVKPKMKDKPASTAALILVHTSAGTDNTMTVDASAQTITGFKAPPPGTTKAPPPAPPPAKPCPPQPSTFGVGAMASTGGLNEAISRAFFFEAIWAPGFPHPKCSRAFAC